MTLQRIVIMGCGRVGAQLGGQGPVEDRRHLRRERDKTPVVQVALARADVNNVARRRLDVRKASFLAHEEAVEASGPK